MLSVCDTVSERKFSVVLEEVEAPLILRWAEKVVVHAMQTKMMTYVTLRLTGEIFEAHA